MQNDSLNTQHIELTDEFYENGGVLFDPEAISLLGTYKDELSMQRAKRNWTQILESNFLLDSENDYLFSRVTEPEIQTFSLHCHFLTACGRYAFWRLINNQAPEAQYLIETAHIPNAELREADFLQAPDLKSVDSLFCTKAPSNSFGNLQSNKLLELIDRAIDRIRELCKKP